MVDRKSGTQVENHTVFESQRQTSHHAVEFALPRTMGDHHTFHITKIFDFQHIRRASGMKFKIRVLDDHPFTTKRFNILKKRRQVIRSITDDLLYDMHMWGRMVVKPGPCFIETDCKIA